MEENLVKHYDPRPVEKRFREQWSRTIGLHHRIEGEAIPFRAYISPVSPTRVQDSNTRYMAVIADTLRRYHHLKGRGSRGVFVQPFMNPRELQLLSNSFDNNETDDVTGTDHSSYITSDPATVSMMEEFMEYYEQIGCPPIASIPIPHDPHIDALAREVFVSLYEKGLLYHAVKTVPWCSCCRSGVSTEEVRWDSATSPVWFLKYQVSGRSDPILVPIMRPELIFGVAAIAVHPDLGCRSDVIGESVRLPLAGRDIPILSSPLVSKTNDTGIMHVIPGHDRISAEIARDEGLETIRVVDESGCIITGTDPGCDGMDRFHCREIVLDRLRTEKTISRVEKWNTCLGHCRYCDTIIEFRSSSEWFLKTAKITERILSVIEQEDPHFEYESWTRIFLESLKSGEDWCISRSLSGSIGIPVYRCDGCQNMVVSSNPLDTCGQCGHAMVLTEKTLDPWFILGAAITMDILNRDENVHAVGSDSVDLLICSRNDISLWVKRVVQLGCLLENKVPRVAIFIAPEVTYSQRINEKPNQVNTSEPRDLLKIFGADVIRFGYANLLPETDRIQLEEDSLSMLQGFVDKLWNAYRFLRLKSSVKIQTDLGDLIVLQSENKLDLSDRWILSRMTDTIEEIERHLDRFRLSDAAVGIMSFIWRDFCNWYLELIRPRIAAMDDPGRDVDTVMSVVFSVCVRLLYPFMPFLSSELWHGIQSEGTDYVNMIWPEAVLGFRDRVAEHDMEELQDIILAIRKLRGELKIPETKPITILIHTPTEKLKDSLTRNAGCIRTLGNVRSLALIDDVNIQGPAATAFLGETSLILPLNGVVDVERERERLKRELEKTEQHIIKCRQKLNNVAFLEKAPESVVQSEKSRLENLESTRNKYLGFLESLS